MSVLYKSFVSGTSYLCQVQVIHVSTVQVICVRYKSFMSVLYKSFVSGTSYLCQVQVIRVRYKYIISTDPLLVMSHDRHVTDDAAQKQCSCYFKRNTVYDRITSHNTAVFELMLMKTLRLVIKLSSHTGILL